MKNEDENNLREGEAEQFGLPLDYFRNSADLIKRKIEWGEEHKDFQNLLNRKKELLENSGFEVPKGYFEDKEKWTEHLQFLSITSLKNEDGFNLPKNYFEKNKTKLLSGSSEEKGARIIVIHRKKIALAAAAIFFVVLGFWTYPIFFETTTTKDCGSIACIDRAEVIDQVNLENFENEDLYELVNPGDLKQDLNIYETDEADEPDSAVQMNSSNS